MVAASTAAAHDAGVPDLLRSVERIHLTQGSWSLGDPVRAVAPRIGAPGALSVRFEVGVSQQEVIDHALQLISTGEADAILVLGGEARAYERKEGGSGHGDGCDDGEDSVPDVTVTRPPDFVHPVEVAAGIVWPPIQQYALIENALGAHEHVDPVALREQVAALWARFNAVAADNPDAAFGSALTASDIATPSARNRPLAYPYNRWHSSQWTVDQASALVFCSAQKAADAGVPADRYVFPRVALHSSAAVTLTARRDLFAWPAMEVLGRLASDHLGQPLAEISLVEIYSCFPAAVRVQQRALGLDMEGTPTLTGGMAFAGGPFNHYVLAATAVMARRLRHEPDSLGLVTTVSGMLSKPGLAVWSARPAGADEGPLMADVADQATAATATVPVAAPTDGGAATVASYTVTFDPDEPLVPARVAVVADLADGSRTAATCQDRSTAQEALRHGLIGAGIHVAHSTFTL